MMGFNCYYVCNYLSGVLSADCLECLVMLCNCGLCVYTNTLTHYATCDVFGVCPSYFESIAMVSHLPKPKPNCSIDFPALCWFITHHSENKNWNEKEKELINWLGLQYFVNGLSQKSLSIFPFICEENDDWKALTAIQNKHTRTIVLTLMATPINLCAS